MQTLKDYFSSRRDQLVEVLSGLVRCNTVNPPGQEHLAAEYVATLLEDWSIPSRTHEAQPGRTNLLADVGQGRPRLLVACHLDTVPPGDGWNTDPFEPVVRDGRLYGRGSSDNKGALAASLLALQYLHAHPDLIDGQFTLACVADEEQGSAFGFEYLFSKGHLTADFAIIPDAETALRKVIVAEKGPLFFDLISYGTQAHGSTPHEGVNAVWNMVALLDKLHDVQLPGEHSLTGSSTMNLGLITGGVAPNVVPATCRATMDVRFPPGTAHTQILDAVRAVMRRTEHELPKSRFELEVRRVQQPFELSPDHPLVKAVCDETQAYLGFRPEPAGMSGSTVAKMCVTRNIPVVNFDSADPGQAHMANESVSIDHLLDFAGLLVCIARRLLAGGRTS